MFNSPVTVIVIVKKNQNKNERVYGCCLEQHAHGGFERRGMLLIRCSQPGSEQWKEDQMDSKQD